ncbi:hypothetical protein DFH06DRAFT_1295951 [Mycena polygramma]|nr:hypothetical protein DFH06DRAFT_1295951 [Mycena polygramma]
MLWFPVWQCSCLAVLFSAFAQIGLWFQRSCGLAKESDDGMDCLDLDTIRCTAYLGPTPSESAWITIYFQLRCTKRFAPAVSVRWGQKRVEEERKGISFGRSTVAVDGEG